MKTVYKELAVEWPTEEWPTFPPSFFSPENFNSNREKWFAEFEKLQYRQGKIIDQQGKYIDEQNKKFRKSWAGELRVVWKKT